MTNLIYINKTRRTIRNKDLTDTLFDEISKAIALVYGPGYVGRIYSGGQDPKGQRGARRTGTTRHDGGRAADIYVYDPQNKKLTGAELAPLAQYWTAKKIGGLGIEMNRGGVHLDEHTNRGMFWDYRKDWDQPEDERKAQFKAVLAGRNGKLPKLHNQRQSRWATLFAAIADVMKRRG